MVLLCFLFSKNRGFNWFVPVSSTNVRIHLSRLIDSIFSSVLFIFVESVSVKFHDHITGLHSRGSFCTNLLRNFPGYPI